MRILNETDSPITITIGKGSLPITIKPKEFTSGLILGNEDIRNVRLSYTSDQIKFEVTNPSTELQLLSDTGIELDYLYEPNKNLKNEN